MVSEFLIKMLCQVISYVSEKEIRNNPGGSLLVKFRYEGAVFLISTPEFPLLLLVLKAAIN